MPTPKDNKDKKKTKVTDLQTALQAVKKELLKKAKKAGSIAQNDINEAIADIPENADILDSLYTALADSGVQIKNDVTASAEDDDAATPPDSALSDEWTMEDGEEVMTED